MRLFSVPEIFIPHPTRIRYEKPAPKSGARKGSRFMALVSGTCVTGGATGHAGPHVKHTLLLDPYIKFHCQIINPNDTVLMRFPCPKMHQIQNFSPRTPLGELKALPKPLTGGERARWPQESLPALGHSHSAYPHFIPWRRLWRVSWVLA